MVSKIIYWLSAPWRRYQQRRALARRIEELRKRDPFIYK